MCASDTACGCLLPCLGEGVATRANERASKLCFRAEQKFFWFQRPEVWIARDVYCTVQVVVKSQILKLESGTGKLQVRKTSSAFLPHFHNSLQSFLKRGTSFRALMFHSFESSRQDPNAQRCEVRRTAACVTFLAGNRPDSTGPHRTCQSQLKESSDVTARCRISPLASLKTCTDTCPIGSRSVQFPHTLLSPIATSMPHLIAGPLLDASTPRDVPATSDFEPQKDNADGRHQTDAAHDKQCWPISLRACPRSTKSVQQVSCQRST